MVEWQAVWRGQWLRTDQWLVIGKGQGPKSSCQEHRQGLKNGNQHFRLNPSPPKVPEPPLSKDFGAPSAEHPVELRKISFERMPLHHWLFLYHWGPLWLWPAQLVLSLLFSPDSQPRKNDFSSVSCPWTGNPLWGILTEGSGRSTSSATGKGILLASSGSSRASNSGQVTEALYKAKAELAIYSWNF